MEKIINIWNMMVRGWRKEGLNTNPKNASWGNMQQSRYEQEKNGIKETGLTANFLQGNPSVMKKMNGTATNPRQ